MKLNYTHQTTPPMKFMGVEIDEKDKEQLSILEEIKSLDIIDNVYNRVYEGNSAFKTYPSLIE